MSRHRDHCPRFCVLCVGGAPVDDLPLEDLRALEELFVPLMSNDFEGVEELDPGVLPEREAEAAAEGLLCQDLRNAATR